MNLHETLRFPPVNLFLVTFQRPQIHLHIHVFLINSIFISYFNRLFREENVIEYGNLTLFGPKVPLHQGRYFFIDLSPKPLLGRHWIRSDSAYGVSEWREREFGKYVECDF